MVTISSKCSDSKADVIYGKNHLAESLGAISL